MSLEYLTDPKLLSQAVLASALTVWGNRVCSSLFKRADIHELLENPNNQHSRYIVLRWAYNLATTLPLDVVERIFQDSVQYCPEQSFIHVVNSYSKPILKTMFSAYISLRYKLPNRKRQIWHFSQQELAFLRQFPPDVNPDPELQLYLFPKFPDLLEFLPKATYAQVETLFFSIVDTMPREQIAKLLTLFNDVKEHECTCVEKENLEEEVEYLERQLQYADECDDYHIDCALSSVKLQLENMQFCPECDRLFVTSPFWACDMEESFLRDMATYTSVREFLPKIYPLLRKGATNEMIVAKMM